MSAGEAGSGLDAFALTLPGTQMSQSHGLGSTKGEVDMMNTLESIPTVLGKMRQDLMDEGFTEDQAFQVVLDLLRRGEVTPSETGQS